MKSFFQRILHDSHPGPPEPPLTAPQTSHVRPTKFAKEERPKAPTSKYSRREDSRVLSRPNEKRSSSRAGPTSGGSPNDRHEPIPPTGYEARLPASRSSPLPTTDLKSPPHARLMKSTKVYEPSLQGSVNVNPYPESSTERLYNQMDGAHLRHMRTPSQNDRVALGGVTPQKQTMESIGGHDDMYKHRDGNKRDRKGHREGESQRLGNSDRNKSKTKEERTERRQGEESDRDMRRQQREIGKGSQRPRDKETDWETERETERERQTDREREKGREREKRKESNKDKDKERVREGNRERDKDKGREKERERRRVREHGRESEERGREKDKTRENEKGEARDSEKDKARSSEQKIVEQARDDRKEVKDRDRMNNEGANKNGQIRETERERYERRERDRKHSGAGRTKRDQDMEEREVQRYPTTYERPHKSVTDATKAGPYFDVQRESASESFPGVHVQAQDDSPSRSSGGKPTLDSRHRDKHHDVEKATRTPRRRESFLAANSIVPPIQPTLASSFSARHALNVPESHLRIAAAHPTLQADSADGDAQKDFRARRAEIPAIFAPPDEPSESASAQHVSTHNTVNLRDGRHGEAELSQHPRNTTARWPLPQEKGVLNTTPIPNAEVRGVVFPGGHGDVQQQPPSGFVHPVASSHTSHYEELAHLSSARRFPQSNTSHYGHLPGNPGKESSHKLHKSDLHEPRRNSPPAVEISYPTSTDISMPSSLRDPFDVRNDSTTQADAHPQTATAARKEQDARGLSTTRPPYIQPMSKNPSPQSQQLGTVMPSDHELPRTAPTNASTQSYLPIDQMQMYNAVDSIARGPSSSNAALSKFVPFRNSSSAPLTSSDNSHSALLSNRAFEKNERIPSDTMPEARLKHQGPGTREIKAFKKSSNNAVEPWLIAEQEAQDTIVYNPRPLVLKNTREDVNLPPQRREPIVVPLSRAASSEQNAGPVAEQIDIPSRTVHTSATLRSSIVPSRGVEIGMMNKGQQVPVMSYDDHPSASNGRNANVTGSTYLAPPVSALEFSKNAEQNPSLLFGKPATQSVEAPPVHAARQHAKETFLSFITGPSQSRARVSKEAVASKGSRPSSGSENVLTSDNQGYSQRNSPSGRREPSLTTSSKNLNSQPITSTDLIRAVIPSSYSRSSSRNVEPAPYLPVSQRTNATQDPVQYEVPKSDQAFQPRLPSFQHARLADILSSPAPVERPTLIYSQTTNLPPPHPLPSSDILHDISHFDSRVGSRPTPTSRLIPFQNVDPHATAGDLGIVSVKTRLHPETLPKQSSHSRSRSNDVSDANNHDAQSLLPPNTQTGIAIVPSIHSTGPLRSGGTQIHDHVKASQKVLSTPVNPIGHTLQLGRQKMERIDSSEPREISPMLHNDLESRSAEYPPKLIPLSQAHPSSTRHQHSQTHSRDLSRITSKESILKSLSSLALKPTVSQTSIPTSVSSESRKRGLFSIFRSKDTRVAEQAVALPAAAAKATATQSGTRTKNTASRRDDTGQEPHMSAPTVPLDRASDHKNPHPKAFTPFRYMTSKRYRTVSAASLEAQDGTAANTVVGSPTASIRSSQPPPIPLPPLRDPFLATQEWRKGEAAEARERSGGKLRRQRPGVVFDVVENPSEEKRPKLRVSRSRT